MSATDQEIIACGSCTWHLQLSKSLSLILELEQGCMTGYTNCTLLRVLADCQAAEVAAQWTLQPGQAWHKHQLPQAAESQTHVQVRKQLRNKMDHCIMDTIDRNKSLEHLVGMHHNAHIKACNNRTIRQFLFCAFYCCLLLLLSCVTVALEDNSMQSIMEMGSH